MEFLRSKVTDGKKLPNFSVKDPAKVFDKFELF